MIELFNKYLEKHSGQLKPPVILFGRAKKYHGLEDINIFLLNSVIYVQLFTKISDTDLNEIMDLLKNRFPGLLFSIVDRSGIPPRMLFLSSEINKDIVYKENGLSYYLDLARPSHPGLFFDIEPARRRVFENSRGKKVLNLFAFTCAFSVCALAGGAESVVNIDNNSNILERGRRNHRLNKIDLSNAGFEKKDVMKNFGFIGKKGSWDLIICDPPSAQGKSFNAQKDYPKLVRRLKEHLEKDGTIMLCLNSPFLGFDFLENIMSDNALKEICRIDPPEEFIPEDRGSGLKVICAKL